MAGVPPVSGEAYTLYFSVTSQADTDIFQANPTIAAGDFQYSNDGGANFANPATLPSVVGGNNKVIQAPLTGGEMTPSVGDAILLAGSDQVGAEWQDILIVLTVTTRDVDDLAYPTVSGRSMDVDATGGVEVGAMQTDTLTADALATSAVTEIQSGLATSANQTTILNRIGAFTGAGVNTILGFLRAIMRSDTDTPSDVGGDYDDATDSLEAISDRLATGTINVISFIEGDTLNFVVGVTFDETLPQSGTYTISATWSKMYFTLKRDMDGDTDAQAVIQIQESNPAAADDGLIVLNGSSTGLTATDASLTVDQAAGTIRLIVTDDAAAQLAELDGLSWDFKEVTSAGASNVIAQGNATISYTPTRAIT